jgi:membrane-associated phospholipid phosphatase
VFLATALGVLLAEASSRLLKELIDRDRPFVAEPEPEPIVREPTSHSLPSGHATVSFACAVVLTAALPRLAVPFYVLAAAIAWSRVVTGVHYPLDVLVGAVLGLAVGWLTITALRRLPGALRRSAPPPPQA